MKRIFIISYNGIHEFDKWFNPLDYPEDYSFHIIDNGNQKIPTRLEAYIWHRCKENIFCAGGWNLALTFGFNWFEEDSVIVTEDDLIFDKDVIDKCFKLCKPNTIVGGRADQFFYSFYCMHKTTYEKVGRFDENFLYVTCEDNDYIHRCALEGIESWTANRDLSDKHLTSTIFSYKFGNQEYLQAKWKPLAREDCSQYAWQWSQGLPATLVPWCGLDHPKFRDTYWDHFIEKHEDFMSVIEYKRFLEYVEKDI